MSDYRLYCLDDAGRMHAEDFAARSDGEAISVARSMKKPVNCELWSLDRFIALIPAYHHKGDAHIQQC